MPNPHVSLSKADLHVRQAGSVPWQGRECQIWACRRQPSDCGTSRRASRGGRNGGGILARKPVPEREEGASSRPLNAALDCAASVR